MKRYFARWDAGGEVKAYVQCKDLAFDVACAILLGMQLDVRTPSMHTSLALCAACWLPPVERGITVNEGI